MVRFPKFPELERDLASVREWEEYSLLNGALGLSVFLAETGRMGESFAMLVRAMQLFDAHGGNPGLHIGISGLGLVISTYHPDNETLDDIDRLLLNRIKRGPPLSCGMRGGLAGIALYAASRYATHPAVGDAVVQELRARAVEFRGTLAWPISIEYAQAQSLEVLATPIHEPGMAHGHAGVLVGLAALARVGSHPARDMLQPALDWLRAVEAYGEEHNRFGWAFFGPLATAGRKRLNPNTWCAGDPGVLISAYWASKLIDSKDTSAWVSAFGDRCAQSILTGNRAGMPERVDLCCGMSSIGNIFLRLFENTQDRAYEGAAQLCLSKASEERHYLTSNGLQYGRTGVSLALEGPTAGPSRKWDRFFGMSLPG